MKRHLRTFVQLLLSIVFVAACMPVQAPQAVEPSQASVELRVRKNIDDLTEEELGNYRHALNKLVEISETAPDSKDGYAYFRALHDVIDVGPCEHGKDTFLPWHRAHLYLFEDALRRSDPPRTANVTIPYWDWSELPSGTRYPLAFEAELLADNSENALFSDNRNMEPICREDNGSTDCDDLPFPRWYLENEVLTQVNWSDPVVGLSFGGAPDGASSCTSSFGSAFGALEQPAHNTMHGSFSPGVMAFPNTAARDPIFWSYHAYIDLLFSQWQEIAGNVVDTCLDCALCGMFHDIDETMPFTVTDVLTTEQLGYRYEYTPTVTPEPAFPPPSEEMPFVPHPAVDIVMSGMKEAELVRTIEITVPEPGFDSVTVRFTGIKVNPFSYEGDLYLHPQSEPFQPQDAGFREKYLADLYMIWMMHADGEHAAHESPEMEIVIDLTDEMRSLAPTHAGESWVASLAVVAHPIPVGDEGAIQPQLPEDSTALIEAMQFDDMTLEIE